MAKTQVITRPTHNHLFGKIIVQRFAFESLFSWVIRQAHAFDLTPKELLAAEEEYWSLYINGFHFHDMEGLGRSFESICSNITFLTLSNNFERALCGRGFNPNELHQHQVQLFNNVNKFSSSLYHSNALLKRELSFCPFCWNEDSIPYFRIEWELGITLYCS